MAQFCGVSLAPNSAFKAPNVTPHEITFTSCYQVAENASSTQVAPTPWDVCKIPLNLEESGCLLSISPHNSVCKLAFTRKAFHAEQKFML